MPFAHEVNRMKLEYQLTDKQKTLLDFIVRAFGTAPQGMVFIFSFTSSGCSTINGEDGWSATVWHTLDRQDLYRFLTLDFVRPMGNSDYMLNMSKIIEAVNNNFYSKYPAIVHDSIFGSPLESSQFFCDIFMVMPFREPFWTIYNDHIKPLADSLSLDIKHGDNVFSGKNIIMKEVWSLTYNSRLVIADCTTRNPNVFYEIGIAHTLGKPTIMITQDIKDITFDINALRAITYEWTPPGMKEFETRLKTAIENVLNDKAD
jgi:hypothetical protein